MDRSTKPRLLNLVRERCRVKHYSLRTEKRAPRRFEWNSPGNLCQITRKIRNEEPEWTATRYCFLGWV